MSVFVFMDILFGFILGSVGGSPAKIVKRRKVQEN